MTKPATSDAEFFEQRGFGQKLGFGLRPALLIVDMVKAFTNPLRGPICWCLRALHRRLIACDSSRLTPEPNLPAAWS